MRPNFTRYSEKDRPSKLLAASLYGNLREVRRLLGQGVSPNVRDVDGDTPLIHATGAGNQLIIRELLAAGADLNLQNDEGLTPFTYALRWRNSRIDQVIPMLIVGSDMDLADNNGYFPRDYAMMAAFYRWKPRAGIEVDQLHLCITWAANEGDAKLLVHYLDNGVPTRILTNALVMSAFEGHAECCRILLGAGAYANGSDIHGNRPLAAAACNLRTELVRLLLKSGAEVDGRNSMKKTPLMLACEAGCLDCCGIGIKEFDKTRYDLVEFLLREGADVNATDESGKTPLHTLALDPAVTVLLLRHGADPFATDDDGCLPLSDVLDEKSRAVVRRCMLEFMTGNEVEEAMDS
jgi:ankyrin repeat protein